MKRRLLSLVCILALVLALGACGKKTAQELFGQIEMNSAEIIVPNVTLSMLNALTFDDKPELIDSDIAGLVYNVDGLYTEISAYGSTGATAEAVIFLSCENAEHAKQVYDVLEQYRKEMTDIYSRYNAAESEKLAAALLRQDGKYVIFCVSPDTAAATEAYYTAVVNAQT